MSRTRLLVTTDATAWGGAEVVLQQLVGELCADHELVVVGVDAAVVDRVVGASPVAGSMVLPPVRGKADLRGIAAHVRAFRRLRPDLVLVNLQHPWASQYALLAALLVRGTRTVAVEHLPMPATAAFQVWVKRRTSARLAAHVAVTESSARLLESLIGLPEGRIRVVRNGVPHRSIKVVRPPLGTGRPLVVAAGRLATEKGFDVLLRAVALLPGLSLWLLGEGSERSRLECLVRELALTDRVVLSGWHPDPPSAFAAADVVAIPSRNESLPLTAAEALQADVPLVVTSVGGMPQVLAGAALLVAPDDVLALAQALQDVLSNPGLAAALRTRGAEVLADLPSIEECAAAYRDLFAEVRRG